MSKIKTKWIPRIGEKFYCVYGFRDRVFVFKDRRATYHNFKVRNLYIFQTKKQAESARKAILKILRGEK